MEVAIFKKSKNNPSDRTLIGTWKGKSVFRVVKEVKNAGVLSSGNYVAFRIVKRGYEIQGIKVSKRGYPFTH